VAVSSGAFGPNQICIGSDSGILDLPVLDSQRYTGENSQVVLCLPMAGF